MWVLYALLSAFFAALTSILAKTGMKNVNSNVGTAVRTVVVLIMAWLIVFLTGKYKELPDITQRSWVFLILSGIATGLSWLCYFKALQIGEASKVVPVDKFSVVITMVLAFLFLGEPLNMKTIAGGVLITIGMLVLVL
ncbi:EamA family transporter [Anaerocolumna xylanovorans]|uniref:Transporter family protein n=1 Tax=Anaerocolumna xylanovorans DSM 12503 TaxID=1121345 RepID=A0A1M7Y0G3_9FIRM|nr:EamA family transporter [Anaerocolumna xylanovorans]SHO45101.1 transporter family protein [Anaerocolumna xylanovorans DSM 12503]